MNSDSEDSEDISILNELSEDDRENVCSMDISVLDRDNDDAAEPFYLHQTFPSKREFRESLKEYAEKNGFRIATGPGSGSRGKKGGRPTFRMICSRGGTPGVKLERTRQSLSLKCDCCFVVVGKEQEDQSIIVSHVNLAHNNGCKPSIQQLTVANNRAGDYYRSLTIDEKRDLKLLCDNRAPTRKIIEYIRSKIPPSVPVTSLTVANWRVSIAKEDIEKGSNTTSSSTLSSSCQIFNSVEFVSGEILQNLMANALEGDGLQIVSYLKLLRKKDPTFAFNLRQNENLTITGIFWQTGRQRYYAQTFCDNLFFDCRRRGNNTLRWPYFAPVVTDENRKTKVIAHAIAVGETLDVYSWLMRSLNDLSGIDHRRVLQVWSDQILSQRFVSELYPNALWRLDYWHLSSVDLEKIPGINSVIANEVRSWLQSKTSEEFEATWILIQESYPRISQHLQRYYTIRDNCASYAIKDRLTLGLTGDALAEQGNAKWHSWFESDILTPVKLLQISLEREGNEIARAEDFLFKLEVKVESSIRSEQSKNLQCLYREQSSYAISIYEKEKAQIPTYLLQEEPRMEDSRVAEVNMRRGSSVSTVLFEESLNAIHVCPDYANMGIPCRHILYARTVARFPLYASSDFHPRWKRVVSGEILPVEVSSCQVEEDPTCHEERQWQESLQSQVDDVPSGSDTRPQIHRSLISYNDVLNISKDIASQMASRNRNAEYYTFLSKILKKITEGEEEMLFSNIFNIPASADDGPSLAGIQASSGRPGKRRIENVPGRMNLKQRPKHRKTSCSFCSSERHTISACLEVSKLGERMTSSKFNEWRSHLNSNRIGKSRGDIQNLPSDWKSVIVVAMGKSPNIRETICQVSPIVDCRPVNKDSIWVLSSQVESLVTSTVKNVIISFKLIRSLTLEE